MSPGKESPSKELVSVSEISKMPEKRFLHRSWDAFTEMGIDASFVLPKLLHFNFSKLIPGGRGNELQWKLLTLVVVVVEDRKVQFHYDHYY